MNKKELENLRTLNATKSMIEALRMPGRKNDWNGKQHKYRYWLAARCQQLDGILKVSICTREDLDKNILVPKWDIFINYEGETYNTRERQDDGTYKWRTAMIMNLEEWYTGRREYDFYMYFNNDADLYRVIGANIKHYREQVKLTQVQLAEQAKISISYLSKIEAAGCDKSLSISVLNQIANVLGVEITEFLRRSDTDEINRSTKTN